VALSLFYLTVCRLLGLIGCCRRDELDKDIELMVLCHEVGILKRQVHGRVRYRPVDRAIHDLKSGGRGDLGEWREGTSPCRSRRTGRETLASSGPHRSLVGGWKHVPVGKEPGLVLSNSIEPGPSLIRLVSQAFELLHSPSDLDRHVSIGLETQFPPSQAR
jgi:hypothetical protein